MIREQHGSLTLGTWPLLNDLGLRAGCASGPNFALHAPGGHDAETILRHRRVLSSILEVPAADWICADQVHSASVAAVDGRHAGRGALDAAGALPACDALFLGEPGLQGMIFTADCLPLVLYDRVRRSGALVHAGWRGAAAGIVPAALQVLRESGSRMQDILAAAGPSIGPCCYQVDEPVYRGLTEAYPECAGSFRTDGYSGGKQRWRLDLEEAVFRQLEERGLPRDNLEKSGLCSCCGPADLASHRKSGAAAGRMASYLIIPGSTTTGGRQD